ncbi:GDSL-type esterase/lipase family protein [Sanguibacter sp. A247]|uniref:GDSL-type esterase/lipase family protein n=1 Tax=unclassified Sanguibacter TaxID=2645534 RepID=UPI003FD8CFA1
MTRKLRICVVGDELAAGVGDPKALGWVGRVVARTGEVDVEHYVLATPGETTTALSGRWEREVEPRLSADTEIDHRLVVALGRHDLAAGLSVARSRLNLANILDVADARHLRTLVVGPPPGLHADDDRLADLSRAYSDVAQRRRVPFVETFAPLVSHDQWHADLAARGDDLPQQAGYGLMAWLVLHSGWHQWLGLASPDA